MPDKKPISIPDHNKKYKYIPPSLRSRMPEYVHNMGVAPETTVTAKAPMFPASTYDRYRYDVATGGSGAVHALKPTYPVFDVLAGRGGLKAAEKGFTLMKSNPGWLSRNSNKVLKAIMLLNQAKEVRDLEK